MYRIHRLKEKRDFRAVFRRGRRFEYPLFRLSVLSREGGGLRAAFVVPKSVDKRATVRNTIRRRAREFLRVRPDLLSAPRDAIFFFKKEAPRVSRKAFYEELQRACEKIGA